MASHIPSFASIGLRILLLGTSLMLFGVAIAARPEFQNVDSDGSWSLHVNSVLARVPIIVGAVMALLGGTRMSVGIRPFVRTLLGSGLFLGAFATPIATSLFDPHLSEHGWTTTELMPLFVFGVLGIIFVSTGLLRVFPGDKQ